MWRFSSQAGGQGRGGLVKIYGLRKVYVRVLSKIIFYLLQDGCRFRAPDFEQGIEGSS